MNTNKSSTQSIVEAGLLAAIILVTYLITNYVPVLGIAFSFAMPIPLTILYVRRGFKLSLMIVIIDTILMSLVSNPVYALAATSLYSMTGLAVGYGIKREWKYSRIIILSTILSIIGVCINFAINIYIILGTNLYKTLEQLVNTLNHSIELAQKFYETSGIPVNTDQLAKLKDMATVQNFYMVIPASIIMVGFLYSLINYNITKSVGKRLNIKLNDVKEFNKWYIDNRLGAIVIIVTLIFLILSNKGIYFGTVGFTMIGSILKISLSVIGCSNLSYFLKNKLKMKKAFIVFACIISFMDVRLNSILVSIGLTDLVFDFRGLDPNSLSAALKEFLIRKMKK